LKIPKFSDQEAERFFEHDYVDRGMIKWQGFYLSDHTSALNEENKLKNKALQRVGLPQMTFEEITEVINNAIVKNQTVQIQTNQCDSDGIFEPLVVGKISGYADDDLCINGDELIELDAIRNVSTV
jgi:Glu-tRNA(Gln) amidotransferase subunit E-like FAD-binding protein